MRKGQLYFGWLLVGDQLLWKGKVEDWEAGEPPLESTLPRQLLLFIVNVVIERSQVALE